MPTLEKFKLLATQCTVAGSPARSPTTSPVIHLRRRKTLRMLLNRPERRTFQRHQEDSPDELRRRDMTLDPPEINGKDAVRGRHKLKDLFVSSPPPLEENNKRHREQGLLQAAGRSRSASAGRRRGGVGSLGPVTAAFRYRLLRRVWRPMLVTIPE